MKVKKTIVIDQDLLKWIEAMIEKREFGSVSHAVEKAVLKLRAEYERSS